MVLTCHASQSTRVIILTKFNVTFHLMFANLLIIIILSTELFEMLTGKGDRPIKIWNASSRKLTKEQCHDLLNEFMPAHVKRRKITQKLYLRSAYNIMCIEALHTKKLELGLFHKFHDTATGTCAGVVSFWKNVPM